MEELLKSENEQSIAKIIALAKKLNVFIEEKKSSADDSTKDIIKNRILKFQSQGPSSFGDALHWEKDERADRNLPFS